MKRLFLLRHAKSSWEDSELADHDRPLAARGRRAAKLIAGHMRRERVRPGLVLCSSSRRTRETLERIVPALDGSIPTLIEQELYAASADRLLDRLRAVEDGVDSVLLIGHNPALEQLVLTLAGKGDKLPELRSKYPTGALATLEFRGRWSGLRPGGASLTDFVRPKQLASH
jgi:phosphohistidine phosphatase